MEETRLRCENERLRLECDRIQARVRELEESSDEEVIRSQYATRRAVERAVEAERERDRLREALEHTLSSFRLVVECKPCRDETIAEAEAALRGKE